MIKMIAKFLIGALPAVMMTAGVASAQEVTLNGAGASFPKPLYDRLIAEYKRIKPEVNINYSSEGSGTGIRKFSEGTIDFGGTDSPMKDAQIAKAAGGKPLHIPMALGAVVPIYNLQNVSDLKLSGPVLAGIYLGEISKWNDAKIAEINPGAKLPDQRIVVVHRSDGSGTTAIFTDYLSKVSPAFKQKIGSGTSVKFTAPGAVSGKGNEQVAAMVTKAANSIGYVELIFAAANNIKFAPVQNQAGEFVSASLEATSSAAGDLSGAPADLRMSITDAADKNAYPIAGLTWILVYENQKDAAKGKALMDFLWWASHDGQAIHPTMHYAPLPKELVGRVEQLLKSVKGPDGKPLRQ